MGEGPKSNKIHIVPEDNVPVEVKDYKITISLCGRAVPADMAVDTDIAEELARRNFAKKAFCAICVSKSEIEFSNKKQDSVRRPVLQHT